VYYRRIDREEFLLLSAVREGKSIEEAIIIALGGESEQIRDQAVRIEQYFSHAAALGWFTAEPLK
jgi:hypothetical protein